MQNKNKNLISVSISVHTEIEVNDELKAKVRNVSCESDEDFAIVALFDASDKCLPRNLLWEGQKLALKF